MAGPFTLAVHMPFTPTSSSRLNLVERWFHELTDKALRGGVFHSVPDLITRIEEYLEVHNNNPKSFSWTAAADDIVAEVARGRVALHAVNQCRNRPLAIDTPCSWLIRSCDFEKHQSGGSITCYDSDIPNLTVFPRVGDVE